jgi:hypothetical protein
MRKRIDVTSPEAAAMRGEIHRRTFVQEGTFLAFPTCFPGVTTPIVADEGRITALDIAADGTIHGGTSGRRAHLFAGLFAPSTGAIFDIGAVAGADSVAAVCCGDKNFAACVNGPGGGRVIARKLQDLHQGLIQEWGFTRRPMEDLGPVSSGERIVHAVADKSRKWMVGASTGHLFVVDLESPTKVELIDSLTGAGHLAVGSQGGVFGLDEGDCLWRFDPASRKLARKAIPLPKGNWGREPLVWAKAPQPRSTGETPMRNHDKDHGRDARETCLPAGTAHGQDAHATRLYLADSDGRLFAFDEGAGFTDLHARSSLSPVTTMAAAPDGRVFGFCGREMSRMFCLQPATGEVRDLGMAVSIFQTRRYGYEFADSLVGPEGQLVFGENDDGGHLWMYFPRA